MNIEGITFIRNGIKLGYPFQESMNSMAPLVNNIYVAVGDSEDETRNLVSQIPKSKIFDTVWDLSPRRGLILSEQTNFIKEKALDADFLIYLQADEVLHEDDYEIIKRDLVRAKEQKADGILFNYIHFYGNTNTVQYTCTTYRREIRIIAPHLVSVGDAQSFKRADGSKPRVIHSKARIFHYGWARMENLMVDKTKALDSLYNDNKNEHSAKFKRLIGLYPFELSHPKVMENWIKTQGSHVDIWKLPLHWGAKDLFKIMRDFWEFFSGYRIGEYKPYEIIS